jgi:hypothetical protein
MKKNAKVKHNSTDRIGTNVRIRMFNARLLARSQFASGRSWDRPARSRFSVVFFGPRANIELVSKFHVALHASHAMVTLKISPCTDVTLTFHFDFWLWLWTGSPCRWRIYGWGSPTPRRRSNCQATKLKSRYGPHWWPGTKTNWPTDRRSQCNLKLNMHHCTANYRPALSSERAPYMKNRESNSHSNKCNIWSLAPKGAGHQDEMSDWPSEVMWLRLNFASIL